MRDKEKIKEENKEIKDQEHEKLIQEAEAGDEWAKEALKYINEGKEMN
ncbi:MAG: hypothetical protein ABIA04_14785 [Pseudomonadota bacterium]